MKNRATLLAVITTVNVLLLFATLLLQARSAISDSVPEVLRAHALQIVDAQGRLRASISVVPEDPKVVWNGKPYPETVLFRLITADGRPNVKIGAHGEGSALLISGEDDPTLVQLLAQGGETTVKVVDKDGNERVIKP